MMKTTLVCAVMVLSGCATQECTDLTDCPDDLVCSVGGSCVTREGERPRLDDGVTAVRGRVEDQEATALGWRVVGTPRVVGTVGVLDVDTEASELTFDPMSFIVTTEEGAMVVFSGTSGVWMEELTTPGARTFTSESLDTPVYAMTCTPTLVPYYDEGAATIDVVVSEPDDDGVVDVEIGVGSTGSDVSVTASFEPL